MGRFTVWVIVLGMAVLAGCGPKELKTVQEQQVGEYTVALLSETGTVKHGGHSLTLEFRKTAEKQLVDVGNVVIAPTMEMAGMAPMVGEAEVKSSGTPGRYTVACNLGMGGLWKVSVRFGNDQTARFSVNAE